LSEHTNEYLIAVGKRLDQIRKEKNLSYREMAQRCDIDFSDISKIAKGQINFKFNTLIELSKALKIQPKELFIFEE